jgi:hypothetical protein
VTFIPVVIAPPPPSLRATDLGERLGKVIQEFELQHQDLSALEVRQALAIASSRAQAGGGSQRTLLAVVAALVVAGGLLVVLTQTRGSIPPWMLMALVAAGAFVIAGWLFALRIR